MSAQFSVSTKPWMSIPFLYMESQVYKPKKKKKFEALQRPKEGRWPPDDTKAVQTLSQAATHESDATVAPAFDASRLHESL